MDVNTRNDTDVDQHATESISGPPGATTSETLTPAEEWVGGNLTSASLRGVRLLEILGGPIRPFHEWKWQEAACFKKTCEGEAAEESSSPTKTEACFSTDSIHHGTDPYVGRRNNSLSFLTYKSIVESFDWGMLEKVSGSSSSPCGRSQATETALKALQPLLANYTTVPNARQLPGCSASGGGAQTSTSSLCIIMVGLPARGKTFLAHKISRLLDWHGFKSKVLNVQMAWRRLLLQHKRQDVPLLLSSCSADNLSSSAVVATDLSSVTPGAKAEPIKCCSSAPCLRKFVNKRSVSNPGRPQSRGHCSSERTTPNKSNYVSAEDFFELVADPNSVARRLYRRVLRGYAEDAKNFFAHGGDVLIVNDDFPTEELRGEAEALFSPLASQTFFMEVIRDRKMNQTFNELKVKDTSEYPTGVDVAEATEDFARRLKYFETFYTTLSSSSSLTGDYECLETTAAAANVSRKSVTAGGKTERGRRRHVRLLDSSEIEVCGITGYLPSRILSYVINLTQHKVQHPIYLVRHGESLYNVENRIGGDPGLTANGEQQANELLGFLASLKEHYVAEANKARGAEAWKNNRDAKECDLCDGQCEHVDEHQDVVEIWTSQLRRAVQTVKNGEQLLGIKLLRRSNLNEIHAGICENFTYKEVHAKYPLIDHFRKNNKYTFRYPEGESYQDMVMRLEPVITELDNADRVVVVVAHQAVLRVLLAYFGSRSAESCVCLEVPHRTVWRCTYNSKGIASLDEMRFDAQ